MPVTSTDIYDVASNVWYPAGPLSAARSGHTATALPDGRVIVAGGTDGTNALDSVEIFEPQTGLFSVLGVLSSPRNDHGAALAGTKVVVAGGRAGDVVLNTADIIDADSGHRREHHAGLGARARQRDVTA